MRQPVLILDSPSWILLLVGILLANLMGTGTIVHKLRALTPPLYCPTDLDYGRVRHPPSPSDPPPPEPQELAARAYLTRLGYRWDAYLVCTWPGRGPSGWRACTARQSNAEPFGFTCRETGCWTGEEWLY